MIKPKKWKPKMAVQVLAMHDSGKRLRDICRKYGLHHSQVQQFLRWNGREPLPRAYVTGSQRDEVIRLYQERGISARQISTVIGVSDSTIRKVLHDSGVRIRPRARLNITEEMRASRLYQSGLTSTQIAELFRCSNEVIRRVLHRQEVRIRPKNKLNDRDMRAILPMYDTGMTPATLGAIYGVTENTIRRAVLQHGGNVRGVRDDVHRRVPLDINAFLRDSEDVHYWTGFAITDGNVHENGTFSVGLQARDIRHLYKLRSFLKSGAKVKKGKVNRGGYKPGAKFAKLAVASKILVDSLKSAGVVPRKTGKEELFKHQFSRHTWRGAVDGDGSVGWHKRGYFWIKLYGSKRLCEQFRQFVLTLNPHCRAKVRHSGSMFAFGQCCGPAEVIARELYRDCSTYLTRKYRRVRRLLRTL